MEDLYDNSIECLDELIGEIDACIEVLSRENFAVNADANIDALSTLNNSFSKSNLVETLKRSNKKIHSSLMKLSKETENQTESLIVRNGSMFPDENEEAKLMKAILQGIQSHFLLINEFEIAESIASECGVSIENEFCLKYQTINRILAAFNFLPPERFDGVEVILEWARQNPENSEILILETHKFRFMSLIQNENPFASIQYARSHLTGLSETHHQEVQSLMAHLIFSESGIAEKQFKHLEEITKSHLYNYYSISSTSLLETSCIAGIQAYETLERFVKIKTKANILCPEVNESQLYKRTRNILSRIPFAAEEAVASEILVGLVEERNDFNWISMAEFPVQVRFPEFKFHSVFICPVTRASLAAGDFPMLLACGHVISNQSLVKISRSNGRFKCPTCQADQEISFATRVFF